MLMLAFLAIQSIDESSSDKGRSPAQIASHVSTILSVGSIILGLLLLQKYCHKQGGGRNKIAHMTYIFAFKVRQTPPSLPPPAIYGSNMTICGWLSNAMSAQYGCPKVPARLP